MADRNENVRASLQALRDFAHQVKNTEAKDTSAGLGGGFTRELTQGVTAFSGHGKGMGTHAVPPLGEAVYFGQIIADYSQAAALLSQEVMIGMTALGFAADGIATQYSDGDELSRMSMDDVYEAFIPDPGQPTVSTEPTEAATTDPEKEPAPVTDDTEPSPSGERPTRPGGGPLVPDPESDEYATPPGQI